MSKFAVKVIAMDVAATMSDDPVTSNGKPTSKQSDWRKSPLTQYDKGKHGPVKKAHWDAALKGFSSVKDMHHSEFTTEQPTVNHKIISKYSKDRAAKPENNGIRDDSEKSPTVVKSGGHHVLVDGNHRASVDAMSDKKTSVRVVDMDAANKAASSLKATHGKTKTRDYHEGALTHEDLIHAASHIKSNPGSKVSDWTGSRMKEYSQHLGPSDKHTQSMHAINSAKSKSELSGIPTHDHYMLSAHKNARAQELK